MTPYYRPPSDCPYFSYNLFRIVLIIFFVVVSRLLFHLVVGLVVLLKVFLYGSTPQSTLSNLKIRQCNDHDPCESNSTSLNLSILRMNSAV